MALKQPLSLLYNTDNRVKKSKYPKNGIINLLCTFIYSLSSSFNHFGQNRSSLSIFNIDNILMSDIFNDVDNGQCLCEKCHQNKHYQLRGETRNSKGQFCRLVSKELEDEMIRAELSGKAKPEKAC